MRKHQSFLGLDTEYMHETPPSLHPTSSSGMCSPAWKAMQVARQKPAAVESGSSSIDPLRWRVGVHLPAYTYTAQPQQSAEGCAYAVGGLPGFEHVLKGQLLSIAAGPQLRVYRPAQLDLNQSQRKSVCFVPVLIQPSSSWPEPDSASSHTLRRPIKGFGYPLHIARLTTSFGGDW